MPTLTLHNLSKSYPTPTTPLLILTNLSLTLSPANPTLALLGPSGSGKSTLLNILGTLDAPTSGTVELDGQNPFTLTPADLARFRARHIGFIFQDHHLLPQLTALENVTLAKLATGRVTPADTARARELLAAVGLADRQDHRPAQLSGGQRQRVAIARALLNQPTLLLADEPTGNLDAPTAAAIATLLHSIAQSAHALLIIATHSPTLAATLPTHLHLPQATLAQKP